MSDELSVIATELAANEFEARIIYRAWTDEAFKQELLSHPKAVLEREAGQQFPEGMEFQVLEATRNHSYFVIPIKPSVDDAEELSDEQLQAVAGGDCIMLSETPDCEGYVFTTACSF